MRLIFVFLFSVLLFATENDIRLQDYDGFQKKWRLVTVRFRKDNGEQRVVYANEKAWADFEAKRAKFSDGAVFAKVGVVTADDPAFPNSLEPMGVMRMQIMVKDSKKYKDTDGWGYALFSQTGLPINTKEGEMKSCHACHKIVPDRDFVFSRVANFIIKKIDYSQRGAIDAAAKAKFVTRNLDALPALLQEQLPKEIKAIRSLEGGLRSHMFSGTIDEIKPILAKEVIENGLPAALISEDNKKFVIVTRDSLNPLCKGLNPARIAMLSIFTPIQENIDQSQVARTNFCY